MRKYLYGLATDKIEGFIPGIIKVFLLILSVIYGLLTRILAVFYSIKPYRLNCKVISAGNITLGGTGKTVLVELIARYLKEQGHNVAVLIRGYKRQGTGERGQGKDYEQMGDEAFMLQKNLKDIPIIVDADRIRAAKKAIRDYAADTVILDDGFQQWKIKKDLEIVVVDALNPFGNRYLIPRGILREQLSALRRADVFVLSKVDLCAGLDSLKDVLLKINPRALVFESKHHPIGFYAFDKEKGLLPPDQFKGKLAALFSGIGDPDAFENLIKGLGINVGLSFKFSDHHPYSPGDLENIMQEAKRKNIDTVITTEKDAARILPCLAARLPARQGRQASSIFHLLSSIFILRVELKVTKDEPGFYNRLLSLYSL